MKIYFHSPAKIARPLHGKRSRKFEAAGFDRCESVEAVQDASQADAVYLRNIPESTTDSLHDALQRFESECGFAQTLNSVASLYIHDCKDECFATWGALDVPVPAHEVCDDVEQVFAFADQHPSFLLRINNEACGDDTTLLRAGDERAIRKAYRSLERRARRLRRTGRGRTRVMSVAMEGERDPAGYAGSYRAFLVGSTIVGGYALIAQEDIVHTSNSLCSSAAERESFFASNSILDDLLQDSEFQALAARAMLATGLDIACLDFVMTGDQPCFLEANALWSPSYSWTGGKAGEAHYHANESMWRERAANYCSWMDRAEFYRSMYEHIARLA
ncbi:MAG: hypothetical protein ACI835_000460 [Planctomycetota bacterium]